MVEQQDVIERIVEQNLGVYRAMPSRLQEDVSQEAQVASDYRGRLVYELLQNADDAMADASTTSDRVSFLVTDDELWIANTGRALTEGDVHGLCGLGASSKVDAAGNRRASIGHKGLGFKSVLEITDEPVRLLAHARRSRSGRATPGRSFDALWQRTVAAGAASRSGDAVPGAVSPEQSARWSRLRGGRVQHRVLLPVPRLARPRAPRGRRRPPARAAADDRAVPQAPRGGRGPRRAGRASRRSAPGPSSASACDEAHRPGPRPTASAVRASTASR